MPSMRWILVLVTAVAWLCTHPAQARPPAAAAHPRAPTVPTAATPTPRVSLDPAAATSSPSVAPDPAAATPPARDAGPGPVDRCLAALALSGLVPDEMRALVDLCQRRGLPTDKLGPSLARVASRGNWEPAALAYLLDGGAPHLDLGTAPEVAHHLWTVRDELRKRVPAGINDKGCENLRRALNGYYADRSAKETPTPPFTAETLQCLIPGSKDLAFLTVPAELDTRLFVAASIGNRVVLQWLGPDEVVTHAGRRTFIVAVPRFAVVTVSATSQASNGPQLWHGFVTADRTVWDNPPTPSCLRLSVELDEDTALLLDGQVLTRGKRLGHHTAVVLAGSHTLVALRCVSRGDCHVRHRETLPAAPTNDICQDIALDLHQPRSVALLPSRAAPGCDAALAWHAGGLAADYLRSNENRTGRVFRDLTVVRGAPRDGLNPTDGDADGPDSLASVAREAWRQGISELVALELRCTSDGSRTLQGTAISVREMLEQGDGEIAGLDLRPVERLKSVEFHGDDQLESSVASVLDQLSGRNYLRFHKGLTSFSYRQRARIEFAAHNNSDPSLTPVLTAHQLYGPRQHSPALCRDLAYDRQLLYSSVHPRAIAVTSDRDELAVDPDGRSIASHEVGTFHARRPGTYLVTARWSDGGPIEDARCVRFTVPDSELWASVTFAGDLTTRTPIRHYAARHLRVMLGHTWYRPLPWLGFGVAGGYTYTRYSSARGEPAWQDLDVAPAETHASLAWGRHAVVVGPQLELWSRRASLPVEFRGRMSLVGGAAVVNIARLAHLPTFAGTSRYANESLRVRPTIDIVGEFGFGYQAGPLAIAHVLSLGAAAINDMVSRAHAADATNGAALFLGLGLILGGAP